MSDAVWQARAMGSGRRLPRRRLAALAGAALAVGCLAAAVAMLAVVSSGPVVPVPVPPAPPPVWIDIQKPVRIFSLQAAVLDGLPLVYTARRLSVGESREDTLSIGAIGGAGPTLRLELRRGVRSGPAVPLFATLARQAADAGLAIDRSGLPDLMPTRFGRFEIADMALAGPAVPRQACSGFRLDLDRPALAITGLACGTAAHPVTHANLGCLLDRLDLASAGEDRALIDFFAATELTRNGGCSGMRLGPDEAHAAWLDDKPAPPSRKSLRRR